jgi:aldose 1-epimerase
MTFAITTEQRQATGGLDGTVYVLSNTAGSRAEVWPAKGFNCYHWRTALAGRAFDVLYADPEFFGSGKPTRTGVPILFPFPNRIRDGRFTWEGKEYRLPLNDPAGKNAIHGFPVRKPWGVVAQGADSDSAWVTAEFVGSKDAPESAALWPADYVLRVTYRMRASALLVEAEVTNPDRVSLPFGLGYHPYFRVPLLAGDAPEHYWVESSAREMWELEDGVPTGKRLGPPAAKDLTQGKRFPELTLDDLFTDLETPSSSAPGTLCWRAGLRQPEKNLEVQVLTSPSFRELVLFTPPHRQAVALEPYTCATDAINMQQRNIDAGLLVLQAGQSWSGVVEFVVASGS